ncbi:hypothetical protein BKA56DRAFT_246455 [Ilyonectria sp. MPI-CAGE-AT-0026]|nr:hypothetical protein BKA56DRAFT_246455 [Ilyonectria sp. MPI-CAGE-AT-0026]
MSHDKILASVSFLAELPLYESTKPYAIIGLCDKKIPESCNTNTVFETIESIPITDMRVADEPLNIDTCGFCWLREESQYLGTSRPFLSVDEDHGTVQEFLEETMQVTKSALGSSAIYVYDWRYRKNETEYDDKNLQEEIKDHRHLTYAPIGVAHSDYSHQGALDRLFLHLTQDELATYKQNGAKVRLINAWRPLGQVENAPLGVCDRRSVHSEDLVEVDKVLPNVVELEAYLYSRPHHKWYYISRQTPEDILMFVQWEGCEIPSDTTGVFHASLSGPQTTVGNKPRESIEVRMILIS